MKQLSIPRLSIKDAQDITQQEQALNALPKQAIAETPWQSYPYKPMVHFAIGYHDKHIYLKYFVSEKDIRATTNQVNGKVWQDSCVEFFIGFDEAGYYNLEFNCIGTALIGYGPSKAERNMLPAHIVQQIITKTTIIRQPDTAVQWELLLCIPVSVFIHHQSLALSGKQCRGNFYKCGDLLSEPHYVSWTQIDTPEPNFHVPKDFGYLQFK
ncbi:MAG: hypothetical protein J7621_08280 [Niastella sp.]|nr:hypothetical protein [Niastella sp.]